MGPPFQAVALSLTKDQSVRNQLEETFRDHPHDPTSQSADWPKRSIVGARADDATASEGKSSNSTMLLEIPKLDLISEIPSDCITKMVCFVLASSLCLVYHHRSPNADSFANNSVQRRVRQPGRLGRLQWKMLMPH